MKWWLTRRLFDAAASTLVACVILVVLVHLMPGDPLAAIIADRPVDPATLAALRERYGVDRTIPEALLDLGRGIVHGDLGISLSVGRPVTEVIGERIGPTILLGSLALLLNFTVGLAIGVWTALHQHSIRSRLIGAATVLGYALPSFAVAMLLVWVFAVQLDWLPAAGFSDPLLRTDASRATVALDHLKHLVLPLAAMVIATLAVPVRQQRSAVLAAASGSWVTAARARGVAPLAIAIRHCWRPALTPVVTLLGLWLPMLVAGAVFIEWVFAWPGLGALIADAATSRDVPLVIGTGMLLVIVVQVGSVMSDVLYRVVDPVQRDR